MAKLQIRSAFQDTKYQKYTDWAIAIAQFETGDFSSRLFVDNRNAFGMSVPKIRPFTGMPSDIMHEGLPMAKYSSTYQSAKDFIQYLTYFNYPTDIKTIDQLVTLMKLKGYFSDNPVKYLLGVKSYLNKNEDNIARPSVSITNPTFGGAPELNMGALANMNLAYDLPAQNIELPKKKA